MATQPRIRPATNADAAAIAQVLQEVADWLIQSDMPMWKGDELDPGQIVADVTAGRYYLAEHFGVSAGVMRFQLEDPLFWPEMPPREAAYVHRLAAKLPTFIAWRSAAAMPAKGYPQRFSREP